MADYIVAVTDYGFPDLRQERELLEPMGVRLVTGQCKTAEEVAELCEQADAVLTQYAPVTAAAIERMNKCKIIVRYGIGIDNVDLETAKRKKIPVANVPDYGVDEVADHTLSLILASVRKIPQVVAKVRNGEWEISPCRPILGLQNRTIGLAGYGNIARAVAKRAQSFGLNIIAYDPYVPEERVQETGAVKVEWEELLRMSDILSIHLPLTGTTRHLINRHAFELMKKTAFIINTSRGGVIQTDDLAEALQQGRIAGAALDVLEQEPIPSDSPLLKLEQCLVTSHCAWYSEDSLLKLQKYAALEVQRVFRGERIKHVVNGVQS